MNVFPNSMILQLDINTVAAGGGSMLVFRSGMFVVGPESAGASPGPACYAKGKRKCNLLLQPSKISLSKMKLSTASSVVQ